MRDKNNTIAILGSGNMGLYIAKGLVNSGMYQASGITLTRRNLSPLASYQDQGFIVTQDTIAPTQQATIIILGVLPRQVNSVLDQICPVLDPSKHLIISIIS